MDSIRTDTATLPDWRKPVLGVFAWFRPSQTHSAESWLAAPPNLTLQARRRAIRVILLMLTIAALSVGDLVLTLTYVRSVGMTEANPIARYVMSFDSAWLLAGWKFASVGLACLIFYIARYKRSGELAAWVACSVLTLLTFHWLNYTHEVEKFTHSLNVLAQSDVPQTMWIRMSE